MTERKNQLLKLQTELTTRIVKIEKDVHSRQTSAKFADQAVDRQNDDVLLNLKNEAQHELQQIEYALQKLQSNHYGICEKCHGDISTQRLDAVPFAVHCEKCAA